MKVSGLISSIMVRQDRDAKEDTLMTCCFCLGQCGANMMTQNEFGFQDTLVGLAVGDGNGTLWALT